MCRQMSVRGSHQLLFFAHSLVLSFETNTCVYGLMNLTGHVLHVIVTSLVDNN
jgi:hypothetical protein